MKKRNFVLIALGLIAVFLISGCSLIGDKVGEKAAEKAIEKSIESSSGGNAKVDISKDGSMEITSKDGSGSMKVGSTYDWPSNLPGDVPKFSSGKITAVVENANEEEKSWMVMLEGVPAGAGEAYKTAAEQAGWKITFTTKSADGSISFAGEKDNRNLSLVLTADSSSEKGISGWVAYTEKLK